MEKDQKMNKQSVSEKRLASNKKDRRQKNKAVVWKVLNVLSHNRILLFVSILLASFSVLLQLYIPILFGDAIDRITAAGKVDFQGTFQILSRVFILILLASAAGWCMNFINNRLAYRTVEEIRARAIRKIQHLPLSYLDAHSTGDIVQRVIADVDQLSDGLIMGLAQLFPGVVTIIATLLFMLSKDVLITLMVLALTPISFFVGKFISSHSYHMFQKQTAIRGRQTALINEMVGNEKVVKAFGYEQSASDRFAEINGELQEYSIWAVFFSSLTNPSTRAVNNVIYALVALAGAHRILAGSLTVGGLTVLLSYANQYMKPFNDITSVLTELQNSFACADRVFTLIEEKSELPDPVEAEAAAGGSLGENAEAGPDVSGLTTSPDPSGNLHRGDVDIKHVYFSYDKSRKLIEDFSFHASPGMKTALVGPTGCGKTTFINLLMRFYDVDEGQILIDGTDIRKMTRGALRRQFGMVLQDTWIKNASVRENIAFGKPDATDEEIIKAAKEARSWDFIRRMPEGLDTRITDEDLSQGEKQLLCITRVMLLKPPMLILDEATSSIDTRTELLIQSAFDRLMEGRTSFVVAHRLSTILDADQILVMKDGKIIEVGNHQTLLLKNGFYTKLYNSQFG